MFCAYSPRMLIYWQSSSILFQVGAVVAYFLKESGSGYGLLFEPSLAQFLIFYSHPRHFVCSVILKVFSVAKRGKMIHLNYNWHYKGPPGYLKVPTALIASTTPTILPTSTTPVT